MQAQQAAAQMRRPAPGAACKLAPHTRIAPHCKRLKARTYCALRAGQEPKPKRPKKDNESTDKEGGAAEKEAALPVVWRYAYQAPDALAQGCTAVLLTCNMRK